MTYKSLKGVFTLLLCLFASISFGQTPKRPNILIIMGDDIGAWNISTYHQGMMGGSTPNIDRIANEGMKFMHYYGEQSCTAGRAAFITGQHPFRTGLLTVGLPGSRIGLQKEDPTIAELLKPLGYVSGQFGKNHLGDRDEFLPNNHGFDEFFGNLYHLNAEEEPEDLDYPKDPEFRKKYGPRGVLDCTADGGCKDTGPMTRKRMETADDEFVGRSLQFMEKAVKQGKPFFTWVNTSRMHVWTRLSPKWEGKTGYGIYADGMAEHDYDVGLLLKKLDDLKIADNTIVIYTSDNGAEVFTWPDGGTIPWHGFKGTTWEGGFRVPALARWPGKIKPGTIETGIWSHMDWAPTLLAAAGVPDVKEQLLKGYVSGDKTFKVHLDGYNQLDNLMGKAPSHREEIFYFSDQSTLNAVRWNDWKVHFTIMEDWVGGKSYKGWPKVVNLKSDPFERAMDESPMYFRWFGDKLWLFVPIQQRVGAFVASFKEFPMRQPSASFNIDTVMQSVSRAGAGKQ
ncbi:MAG: arylsulfatase [Rhodocyclaceae bacterium]|nr:arylsulfatase [Rhodocyclaceae bacterium]